METHPQRMMHSSIPLSCSYEYLGYSTHECEIDKQMQSIILGPIFTFLDGGTATLARHPHTRKYF